MKKILISVLSALLVLAVVGGVAVAAGGNFIPPFVLIGENAEMQVTSPFVYTTFWAGGGKDFTLKEGEIVKLYPGAEVAIGEVTIQNVSPFAYGINFYVTPVSVGGDVWPALDTVLISGPGEYRSGQLTIAGGTTVTLKIKVTVPYGAGPSAPFKGLQLYIGAAPPPSDIPGKG